MIETETYKQRLLDERDLLVKELSELGIHNPQVPADWIATPEDPSNAEADKNIVADRKEEWGERRAEIEPLEARYNNVVRALAKIEVGTYGICEISKNEIEPERLDANPAARTCIAHLNDEAQLPK